MAMRMFFGACCCIAAMMSWYFSLMPMTPCGAPTISMAGDHAAQERLGVVVQQLLVLVQQRLALGGVGDDQRHARSQLHRRGKSAAARAHDAKLTHAPAVMGCDLPLAAPICDTPASGAMGEILKVIHNSD